jgi:hypothetical protein
MLPVVLCGTFSLFVLATGFLYGGIDVSLATAQIRFSHPLPYDNEIPFIFSEQIQNHAIRKPMVEDWHSSDRPPLQTGLVFAERRYNPEPRQLASQVTGALAQSTWILALWILFTALEIESAAIALVLAACLSSGFVLVNTFFVWPKLFAAALSIGALIPLLVGKQRPLAGQTNLYAILSGSLLAFGLLAHGGAVFAVLGAAVTLLLIRVRIPPRHVAILLAVAFVLYLPWLLYQHFYNPQGNRLLKWHLAGG